MNILVTGGASGLGKAITEQLAQSPANTVYFTYHRSAQAAQELAQRYSNVKGLSCNFEDKSSIQSLLDQLEGFQLNALINNALTGIETNHFHKLSPDFFAESFNRNIIPVIKITQQVILNFRKQKSGQIVTILSNYILGNPPIGLSEYVAQKNYLLSLSKSWSVENIKFNISSIALSPAFMQTNLTKETDERVIEEMVNNSPDKKLLSPADVAHTVDKILQSPSGSWKNIVINKPSDINTIPL